jgi:serine protease Do
MRSMFRGLSLAAVAAVFLVIGLVAASQFGLTPASRAETPGAFWSEGKDRAPAVQAPSFADLAERLAPSVVNISIATVVKGAGGSGFSFGPDSPFRDFFGDEFFRRFFEERNGVQRPREFKQRSLGSGFIVSRDGYIVTNNHVVEKADEIVVILSGGEEYRARKVGADSKTDIALIKIEARQELPACNLGDSESVRVGDWVLAIGNPFGLGHTVTAGIVSAKGRDLGAGAYDDFIQTDAPINPGNSGGPLFDTAGNVVGINTAIIPGGGGGIGFAIPVNLAKPVLAQLRANKKVMRAQLGISIQTITADLAESLDLPDRKGALVADVMRGSPAERGGLKRRDVIIAFNGREVKNAHDLPAMVAYLPVGSEAEVAFLREGRKETRRLKLAEMKDEEGSPAAAAEEQAPGTSSEEALGFTVTAVTPEVAREMGIKEDARGVAVSEVRDGSPAAAANLRPGDLILEVDRSETSDLASFAKAMEKVRGKKVFSLMISREGKTSLLPLRRG